MEKPSPIYELAERLVEAYRETKAELAASPNRTGHAEELDFLTARLAAVLEMEAASGRLTYTL
jgi:7-keto-8-aminopelargonate synthetase-like enzyme